MRPCSPSGRTHIPLYLVPLSSLAGKLSPQAVPLRFMGQLSAFRLGLHSSYMEVQAAAPRLLSFQPPLHEARASLAPQVQASAQVDVMGKQLQRVNGKAQHLHRMSTVGCYLSLLLHWDCCCNVYSSDALSGFELGIWKINDMDMAFCFTGI